MLRNKELSKGLLIDYDFKHIAESDNPFEICKLPYFVKDAVALFYNNPIIESNENKFLIGFLECRFGIYNVVTFRWISTFGELQDIYEMLTLKKLIINGNESN
jgi:hypothetical protein